MRKMIRLVDTIKSPFLEGIFVELYKLNVFEWLDEDNYKIINNEYYNIHSPNKIASNDINNIALVYVNDSDYVVVENNYVCIDFKNDILAKIIYNKFGDKWNRIWDLLVEEHYNPIHNYNMTELETRALYNGNTRKQKTKITSIANNSDFKYGFNSSEATPTDKSSSGATTSGELDDNQIIDNGSDTGTISHTKSGNIGVTTTQKMLVDEMDIRDRFNFFNIIYKDVDSILCLHVY